MPSAMKYIPPSDKDRSIFSQVLLSEFTKRRDAYIKALSYYDGVVKAPFEVDENDPEYDPDVDNTVINLVKMAVDRTTSFLFPALPDIQTDPDSIEDTLEEIWLRDFLEVNGGLAMLTKWAMRGFLAGHTFIWVKKGKPYPKMSILHPLSVSVFWKADDISDILWYEQRFYNNGIIYIRDFVKQADDTWMVYLYSGQMGSTSREEVILSQVSSHGDTFAMLNYDNAPYGDFALVETARHKSITPPLIGVPHLPHPDNFYGSGEFTEKDLLDKINQIASERTRIIRQNADPVDVVTGSNISEIEGQGNIVAIPNPAAKVSRLQLSSDLHAVNTTLDHLIEQFLGIMRVVILKGEAKDLQRVTNAAVRTLFLDALAKNEVLWAAYKQGLATAMKLALEYAYADGLLAITNPIEIKISLGMKSPLPVDMTEIANTNALAINAGYRSLYTAAISLGDNPKFEKAIIEQEFEEGLKRQQRTMELAASFAPDPQDEQSDGSSSNDGSSNSK